MKVAASVISLGSVGKGFHRCLCVPFTLSCRVNLCSVIYIFSAARAKTTTQVAPRTTASSGLALGSLVGRLCKYNYYLEVHSFYLLILLNIGAFYFKICFEVTIKKLKIFFEIFEE